MLELKNNSMILQLIFNIRITGEIQKYFSTLLSYTLSFDMNKFGSLKVLIEPEKICKVRKLICQSTQKKSVKYANVQSFWRLINNFYMNKRRPIV